jgi:hypothetical protein
MELSEKIKEKLAEAVQIWADDNLVGKPAILANAMYFSIEAAMIKQIEEIESTFKEE